MAYDLGVLGTYGKVENPAEGGKVNPITSGQGAPVLPADYKTTISRIPVSQAELKTMTPEKKAALQRDPVTGEWVQRVVFADPRYADQQMPSFRDNTARQATDALFKQDIRNPLNYQRTAPTVNVGLNASRQGQQIDQGATNAMQAFGVMDRNSQADALGMQQQAALGLAPSVAAIQQQQGLDSALSGQFAMANSARGGAAQRGAAQGMAAQQAGQMQQQAVGQAAALRAQEMAQARGAYGDLAGAMRAGDLGQGQLAGQLAMGQADLLQQQQLANQGVQAQASLTDAQLSAEQQLANQRGITQQQQVDDVRMLGLVGATQAADEQMMEAQMASQDQYLRLLGLQSGVALDSAMAGRKQANKVFGGAMNAAGAMLGMG
jgi:hypothetical protein